METFAGRPRRVSLQDLADALGLSKATVCRALLGRSRIAEATRLKVKEAAERLGYHPDPALSALAKHRWVAGDPGRASYAVALIRIQGTEAKGRREREAGNLHPSTEPFRRRCSELGLHYSEWLLEEQHSPRHLGHVLYSRGVNGVIFKIEGPPPQFEFPLEHFSCVTIGDDRHVHPTHALIDDWFRGVLQLARRARAAGYRRLGFANFHRRNPAIDDLVAAAIGLARAEAQAEHGEQPAVFRYPEGDRPIDEVYDAESKRFAAWRRREKPDVILDTNRLAYWWLQDARVALPKQVGYATLMGPASGAEAGLSGVRLNRDLQASQAVELLFNLMQLNMLGLPAHPMRLIISSEWHEGQTLGRKAPAPRRPARSSAVGPRPRAAARGTKKKPPLR